MIDKRRPLDQSFIDGMRERIEIANTIDKLQAHISDPKGNPLQRTQIDCAKILLAKCIPDLKAIEHSGEINRRELTREELIERLTAIHTRAVAAPEPPRIAGPVDTATAAATTH